MRILTICSGLLFLAGIAVASPCQDHDRKESPFEGLRWKEGSAEVLVTGVWYRPLSIDGIAVGEILDFCGKQWPGRREKRFGEDLVEAMVLMGHAPPAKVDLELVGLEDGEKVTLRGVKMSAENRRKIRNAGRPPSRPRAPVVLGKEDALSDLNAFAAGLRDQFAYLEMKGLDLDGELDELREEMPESVRAAWFSDRLNRILLRFGDGHANVSSADETKPQGYAPVLLFPAGGGVVAVRPDRTALLDAERPFVVSIDREPIETWIGAMKPFVAAGSPQLVRHRALRGLREIERLRLQRGLAEQSSVRYGLAAEPGAEDVREMEFELGARRPSYGNWPRRESRRIEGRIGYLRLERMSDRLVPHLRETMESFRETEGLIVDVRGNGGGSRSLLLALAGYLVGPDERPWVGNVAAYRKSSRFGDDHLEARFMYRAKNERWSRSQGAAIEAIAKSFRSEWTLPVQFSDWHYLVLDRTGHPDEYFYDRPVIVLADSGCFSATDIFLGALSGRPRVTLMGSASAGGSARSQSFDLPKSGILVRCASMASFRPDGRLYDGRGVEVDIEVPALPTDFLLGGTDACLDAAVARLRGR